MKAAIYDLRTMPASYDILTFLVVAKSKGADEIQFIPEFGPNRKPYSIDEKQFRLTHIIYPMCSLMGLGYSTYRIQGYEIEWSDKPHFLCEILKEYRNNPNLRWPQPSERAKEIVQAEFPEPPVVITLRETYTEGRNSNLKEWGKFADHVYKDNDVVFIRDTAKWNDDIRGNYGICFPTFPIASIDLDIRLALYQHAKINFSVGGGPTILLHYSQDIPYRTFKMAYGGYKSSSVDFLTEMGFPPGSQFPWHSKDQKIVWEDDTFDNLRREYDQWILEPIPQSRVGIIGEK
jgi:hypothetical protein